MKSLNVKKIATAAAGAALLGAAFAGAVSVDSSGLENFNFFAAGSPQVKLVVGAKAAPSDAVAAANIAAMIGNLAYTSEDITVVGADQLSCSGGTATSTSGDDRVSLEVTTPGVNPNVAYQMKTFIGNDQYGAYLDANLTDDRTDSMTSSQILSSTSPYSSAGRKVTASETSLAFKGTITDSQVGRSYTEEERYFLYAKTLYDTSVKKVKAKLPQLGYEAGFTNPIQVCTELTPDDNTCSDTYKTVKHRLKVKLLGADWIIYGMDNFVTDGTMNTSSVITLGKEVQYKEFMQIGDEVTAPSGIKVKLKDISAVPTTAQQLLSVSFEVYDKDGKLLDATTLQQDQEYNKNQIVIRVFAVFAGLGQTSYAQVSIFSDKLALQNGAIVNTNNQYWRVSLIGGGSSYGSSISRIQLTRTVVDDLNAGDSVAFLQKPQLLKLTYTGLSDVTYDTLSLAASSGAFRVSATDQATIDLSYLRVTSSLTSPFDFGTTSVKEFNLITDATPAGNATQGAIFYADPTTGLAVPYFDSSATGNASYTSAVTDLGFSTRTGLTVNNLTAQCATLGTVANGTSLATNTSLAVTGLDIAATSTVGSGRPSTSGFVASSLSGTNAFSVTAASMHSGCTSGNFQITLGTYNGTITPAVGTSGVTYQVLSNYVTYRYGSNSVTIRVDPTGISSGSTDVTGNYTLYIPEYQKDDDTTLGAFLFDIGYGDQATPRLAPSSGTATAAYNTSYGTSTTTGTAYEAGFISPRGSKLDVLSMTSASLKYATSLAYGLYTLSTAGVDTTANKATSDFKAGETALDSNGYKVLVKSITAKGGGGVANATVKGADGLKPSADKAFVVKALDTSSSPLVLTDAEASTTQPLIVVGGPLVNSVAAQALAGSPAPTASMEPVVKVQGDKILVYGYTAADTESAANELISWLASNAETVTGR